MANVWILVTVSAFLFVAGQPLYWLAPEAFKKGRMPLFLPPIFGLASLALFAPLVVTQGKSLLWMDIGAVLLFLGGLAIMTRQFLKEKRIQFWLDRETLIGIAIFFSILAWGVNSSWQLSTRYMNGVDVAGYSASSQYMRDWPGYQVAADRLKSDLKLEDVWDARTKNNLLIDTQFMIASEFVLKAFRWGYVVIAAWVTERLELDSVFRINFIFLAFSVVALFSVIVGFSEYWGCSRPIAVIVGAAVSLNSNLLNTVIQGQYAQVLTSATFLLFLWILLMILEGKQERGLRPQLFLAVIFASWMSIYNEMMFTSIVVLGLLGGLLVLVNRGGGILSLAQNLVLSFSAGFLLSWPVAVEWVGFLGRHLKNVKIGGWPQPHWALPAEILGISNMYFRHFVTFEVERKVGQEFWVFLMSFILVPLAILLFSRMSKLRSLFTLAAILFILVVLIKTMFVEGIHSYQYMKAYTFFLPVLAAILFSQFLLAIKGQLYRFAAACFVSLATAGLVFSSASFYVEILNKGQVIEESVYNLREELPKLGNPLLWIAPGDIFSYMISAVTPVGWINHSNQKSLHLNGDRKISYVVLKSRAPADILAELREMWPVSLETADLVVFDTPYRGSDLGSEGGSDLEKPTAAAKRLLKIL